MADTVSSAKVFENNSGEYIYRFTNQSDGTGESAVAKVDISSLTNALGASGTKSVIDRIEYSVNAFNYIHVYWDHTSDVTIAVLSGDGVMDFSWFGGVIDTGSGGTGDITFTTDGGADGASYDITLYFQIK